MSIWREEENTERMEGFYIFQLTFILSPANFNIITAHKNKILRAVRLQLLAEKALFWTSRICL